MGIKASCPSDALDNVWIDDKSAPNCFNCGCDFSLRRRRHHCRCCGGVYCALCWGEMATLEEAYGFPGPVPICTVCGDVYKQNGNMFLLRRGITVAQTHEPRSNVNHTSQIPPLANANIKSRKFKTNILTLFHWRPFTRHTKLRFIKTKTSKEVLRSARTGMTPRESSLSGGTGPGTRDSGGDRLVASMAEEDSWFIDLASVEAIQLVNFSDKDGGEYICITTALEEHRIQAVKVRFEEIAMPPPRPTAVPIPKMINNNNNNNDDDPTNINSQLLNGLSPSTQSNMFNNTTNNNLNSYQSLGRGGSMINKGAVMAGGGNSARRGLGGNNNNDGNTQQYFADAGTKNSNNNNNNNNDDAGSTIGGLDSPGGEKASASDRRSAISMGTRLRTVMLDSKGTQLLYNALLAAHKVCQTRTKHVPPEVRGVVEVDVPEEEVGTSNQATPRLTTRATAPVGGFSAEKSNSYRAAYTSDNDDDDRRSQGSNGSRRAKK